MSDGSRKNEFGSGPSVIIALSCVLLVIINVVSPGICIMLWGEVTDMLI